MMNEPENAAMIVKPDSRPTAFTAGRKAGRRISTNGAGRAQSRRTCAASSPFRNTGFLRGLVLFAALVVLSGCDIVETEFSEIEFDTVTFQTYSVDEPQVVYFNDYESWSMFYLRHYSGIQNGTTPPVAPQIDFDLNTLVGIFWGEQPSGCTHDAYAVDMVERRSSTLRITVGPLNDLGTCRMITYPQQYVIIPVRTNRIELAGQPPAQIES